MQMPVPHWNWPGLHLNSAALRKHGFDQVNKRNDTSSLPRLHRRWSVYIRLNVHLSVLVSIQVIQFPLAAAPSLGPGVGGLQKNMHPFYFRRTDGRSAPQKSSTIHHVWDRKSGAKRKYNIGESVKIKGPVSRANVSNRSSLGLVRVVSQPFRQGRRKTHHRSTKPCYL